MSPGFSTAVLRCGIAVASLALPQALGAADITHVGTTVDDLITLQVISGARNGCGPAKFDVVRVLPDGTSGAEGFRIPDGRSIIITELDWYYFNGPPGLTVVLSVFAENLRDPSKRNIVFQSPLRLGSDGVGGASERMTTGFAVSSSARLCFDVLNGSVGYPMRLSKVLLRGYLVDQR
jgi:hypothetical protein